MAKQKGADDFSATKRLRGLVAGVIAAPCAVDREAWLELVSADVARKYKDQLLALEARMRAEAQELATGAPSLPQRLADLREQLADLKLDGFIVPHADEYQCEYTPACADRLAYLTGFTGSAGAAVVLKNKAALFVDGRYTLQAKAQTSAQLFEHCHISDNPPGDWLKENIKAGARIGFDPWLHTPAQHKRLEDAVKAAGGQLVACESNPIDAIWESQPEAPVSPIVPQPRKYAGQGSMKKRVALASQLIEDKVDAVVLTAPDSIAWLLNIRGRDVAHTPLPLSFAIVTAGGKVKLFVDPRKVPQRTKRHLGAHVKISPTQDLPKALDDLGFKKNVVQVDPKSTSMFIFNRLTKAGATIKRADDPCRLPKACKNHTELAGMRACHIRDGVALTRGLALLKQTAATGKFTEMEVSDRLDALRGEMDLFQDLSFPCIIGAGPNGAIVHYRADEKTNRLIKSGELLLIDSGGQYLDGTTDVTRTIAIGTPTAAMRRHFTLVLKGHIDLACARFPEGTTGHALDVLARLPLWVAGLDFDHGTGHGVGSYLGVHEGPQNVGSSPGGSELEPGMVLSNEPGYYKAGAYGIRIESLVVVTELENIPGAEQKTFGFETITMAPIDRDLVDVSLLSADEIAWLNSYHAQVRTALTPHLSPGDAAWLEEATRPL